MTVARLGSVKAAARALSVSEPAVSGAVGSLRREFGDDLYVRSGGTLVLTPGGHRLATSAGEILALADEAKRAVRDSGGAQSTLRVAATQSVAEFTAEPLLDAFIRRHPDIDVKLQIARGQDFADLLADGHVDIVLGPSAARDQAPRSRPNRFCATGSSSSLRRATRWRDRTRCRRPRSSARRGSSGPSGRLVDRHRRVPRAAVDRGARTRAYPNFAAALAQTAAGRGVTLAIAHTIRDELDRGALVELDVRGTPIAGLWYVSVLPPQQRTERRRTARVRRHARGGQGHARPRRRRARGAVRPDGTLELSSR